MHDKQKNTQKHIKIKFEVIQMNNIGNRLREERNKLGLSQEKLAEVGGVQKLAQTNYETGKRIPTGEYLAKIAEIGADVNYILTGVRMPKSEVLAAKEFIDEVGGLTAASSERRLKRSLAETDGEGGAANDVNISPKKQELLRLLERLDENALDDAIYSTKKLVEGFEMRNELAQMRQMMSKQRMTA
jgi:transcriptional regulator with XRE-family HTH domain